MKRRIREAFLEVVGPVLPVTALVVFLQLAVVRVSAALFLRFGIGVVLIIVGLFLFLLGVRIGLIPLGEHIGSHLPERVGPWLLAGLTLVLGFAATIAEPDVRVLSGVVGDVTEGRLQDTVLIVIIAAGLGLALTGAVVRQIVQARVAVVLGGAYAVALAVMPFVPQQYIAIALDSGATTTGPLTVPIIMALGLGVARTLVGRNTLEEGFGLIGIASVGPVLVLLIIGLFA